jgi:hypothetical protein
LKGKRFKNEEKTKSMKQNEDKACWPSPVAQLVKDIGDQAWQPFVWP